MPASLWSYSLAENRWTQLSPGGVAPSSRQGHVAVLDAAGGQLLLHGGMDVEYQDLGDLWSYSLAENRWTQLSPAGAAPEGRHIHVAVLGAAWGRLLLHGGRRQDNDDTGNPALTVFDDLWTTLYDCPTGRPCDSHAAVRVPQRTSAPGQQSPAVCQGTRYYAVARGATPHDVVGLRYAAVR